MEVEWKVDRDAKHLIFEKINLKVKSLKGRGVKSVLDLGGGSGWYTWQLKKIAPEVEIINMDIQIFGEPNKELSQVIADMTALPFRNSSFDAVVAHASLHHVPEKLTNVLKDINRILKPTGTLLIAEPTEGNPISGLAKKVISTDHHDEGEKPFHHSTLEKAVKAIFKVQDIEYHFYLSYLAPHLVGRTPKSLKKTGLSVTKCLYSLDEKMLKELPGLRKNSAYISIIAVKE